MNRRIVGLVVLAGAIFLAPAAGAASRVVDRTGALHACYNKTTGALRLVAVGKRCRRGEKAISFNQNGRNGTSGRNGTNGSNGSNGANGAAVAARARSIAPLTLSNSPQSDPLTGNAWTQQANEFDVLYVQIRASNPTSCTFDMPNPSPPPPTTSFPGTMSGEIDLDGNSVATFTMSGGGPTPAPVSVTPNGIPIFEPAAAAGHTVTVKAQDNCNSGGHFVLNSAAIDVVAAH